MKDASKNTVSSETRDAAASSAAGGYDHLRDEARRAYQAGKDWERTFVKRVQQNPLQSLLIAGGVGVLVGLLWRRK